MNFEIGLQVEADFMDYGGEDFMIVVCAISESSKVARTKNKSTSELRRSGFFENGRVFLGHPTDAKLITARVTGRSSKRSVKGWASRSG